MTPGDDEATRAGTRWLTLDECASRHGAYRWAEHRLFELTGSWASGPGTPAPARLHLFGASAQHAWHAQLWADRLPVLADVDPDALTRPIGPLLAPLLDALEPPSRDGSTAPAGGDLAAFRFLAGLYRVTLPRLLASYERHRGALAEVADGPSIRALGLVRRDGATELAAGHALLETLVRTAPDPAGAGAAVEATVLALEGLLGRAAPGEGADADLVPWAGAALERPHGEL